MCPRKFLTFWMNGEMMIGLDTGFFVELLRGQVQSKEVWNSLVEGNEEALVSCLTLFEIERLGLKNVMEGTAILLEAISAVCGIVWIDGSEVLSSAAGISHGNGIPAMDSIILAGLIEGGVQRIYTTDRHFGEYKRKGLRVINLRT